eukprot:1148569-Pelagomonas_calceolata.AAC.3
MMQHTATPFLNLIEGLWRFRKKGAGRAQPLSSPCKGAGRAQPLSYPHLARGWQGTAPVTWWSVCLV